MAGVHVGGPFGDIYRDWTTKRAGRRAGCDARSWRIEHGRRIGKEDDGKTRGAVNPVDSPRLAFRRVRIEIPPGFSGCR